MRRHTQEAEYAGLALDTQAGFTMLRMMLPALRPQQKNSRCAEDTLALIIEQWVIDANESLRTTGGGETFASYTPTLRKALSPKQRQKARECMRANVLSTPLYCMKKSTPSCATLTVSFDFSQIRADTLLRAVCRSCSCSFWPHACSVRTSRSSSMAPS